MSKRTRPMDARDIMTARVVALKPGTMAPEVGRGDTCFRVVNGAPQIILELVQAETR